MNRRVTRTEIVDDNAVVDTTTKKVAGYSAFAQFFYLIFGILEFILLIRFVFRLTGANPASGIVRVIYSISNILMAPYRFIFPTSQVEGAVFEWSVLVAMLFYALFAWIVLRLIEIVFTADTAQDAL